LLDGLFTCFRRCSMPVLRACSLPRLPACSLAGVLACCFDRMPAYMHDCLLPCLLPWTVIDHSLVCLLARSLACWFPCLLACLLVRSHYREAELIEAIVEG
jgi:hypothetical protein